MLPTVLIVVWEANNEGLETRQRDAAYKALSQRQVVTFVHFFHERETHGVTIDSMGYIQ